MSATRHILFVGLGSPHGDDQIGWLIADALQQQLSRYSDISARKTAVPLDVIDWLDDVTDLHVVDACWSGGQVGSLSVLRSSSDDIAGGFPELERLRSNGSHDFGLAAVFDLASKLGRLPEHVVVHAVTGCSFEPGEEVSAELVERIPEITRNILKELTDARDVTRAVATESG